MLMALLLIQFDLRVTPAAHEGLDEEDEDFHHRSSLFQAGAEAPLVKVPLAGSPAEIHSDQISDDMLLLGHCGAAPLCCGRGQEEHWGGPVAVLVPD